MSRPFIYIYIYFKIDTPLKRQRARERQNSVSVRYFPIRLNIVAKKRKGEKRRKEGRKGGGFINEPLWLEENRDTRSNKDPREDTVRPVNFELSYFTENESFPISFVSVPITLLSPSLPLNLARSVDTRDPIFPSFIKFFPLRRCNDK